MVAEWWSELLPYVMLPFTLIGLVSLIRGWEAEGIWWVSRQRYRMLAEKLLLAAEKEAYEFSLLREAERNYHDQSLHWWAWNELLRFHEVPHEPRAVEHEHDERPAASTPGPALPTVGSHDPALGSGADSGGRFNFPL